MGQGDLGSVEHISEEHVRASFDEGVRGSTDMLTLPEVVRGVAGLTTVVTLAASGFIALFPSIAAGGASSSTVLTWLAGLGGNALAGWVANWASRETVDLVYGDKAKKRALIEQVALDLEKQLVQNNSFAEELASLLDQTSSVSTALDTVKTQTDLQNELLAALHADLQRSDIIKGRLHRLLSRELEQIETRIKAKIETEHSATRDVVQRETLEIKNLLASLPRIEKQFNLLLHQRGVEAGNQLTSTDAALQTQIETARVLFREGHITTAQTVLLKLQEQSKQSNASTQLRSKVENFLGCCALTLDGFDVARAYFKEALAHTPDNPDVMTNDAMAALLSGKAEEALQLSEKARALNKQDAHATSVYIQALYKVRGEEKVRELLTNEVWIAADAVCAAALASIKYETGSYREAEALLYKVIEADQHDAQLYMLLANVIIAPLQQTLLEGASLTAELVAQLEEAEAVLSQAVALYEKHDNRNSLHAALVSRAGVRCLLGRLEDGLRDCDYVLAKNEIEYGALENKGRILLELGRSGDAIPCFEKILSQPKRDDSKPTRYRTYLIGDKGTDVALLLASAYVEVGQSNKAVNLLNPLFKPHAEDRTQFAVAELLLIAQAEANDEFAADETVRLIKETWPNEPKAKAVIAEYAARHGDNVEAIKLLQEAIAFSDEPLQRRFVTKLAYLFYRERNYSEAVRLLQPVVDKSQDNRDLRLYIVCLYNSQQLAEALRLSRLIRTTGGVTPEISEIEARILEKVGDVHQARKIWEQLLEVEPNNVSYRIHAAFVELRAGKRQIARELILEIPYDAIKNDVDMLINIARLRAFLDLPEVLAFAYRARRIAFDNPDIHLEYITQCFNLRGPEAEDTLRERSEVSVGDAVHLSRNGKTTVFIIVDEEPIYRERGELPTNDTRAKNLLGRRKGECIRLQETLMGTQEYEITDIQSKYVYASHETTRLFETGVLHHAGIEVSDVTTSDFSQRFVQFLDQRAQQQPDIKALYTQHPLPLSTFASTINRSMLDVWSALVQSPSDYVFSASGTQEEAKTQAHILASTKAVVVDLLSLFTIAHLSIESVISRRFDRIFVAQSLLDQLHQYELDLAGPQPTGTIGSLSGQHYFIDIPPAFTERKRALLQKVLEFVRSSAQVMPTMSLLETDQEFLELLGTEATTSILLAKEQNIPLYSDDLRLRQVAHHQFQVESIESQAVLLDMHHEQMLGDDEYYNAISRLAQSNYHFVRINVDCLIFVLEQNRMIVDTQVHKVFKWLQGPDCDVEAAISVLAELIKRVWLKQLLPHQKVFVLDLALTTLVTGRRVSEVLARLKAELRSRFRLIEFKLVEVLLHIELWQQQRFR